MSVETDSLTILDQQGQPLGRLLKVGQRFAPEDPSLAGAALAGADLTDVDFSNSKLENADFRDALLEGCRFDEVAATRTNFSGAQFIDCSFRRASLRGSCFDECEIRNSNFDSADIRTTTWSNARLDDVVLTDARLNHAVLNETSFINSRFRGAHFTDVILGGNLFSRCTGLHEIRGLHRVRHLGPGTLDSETMRESIAALPDEFAIGLGFLPAELDKLREIYPVNAERPRLFIHAPESAYDFAIELQAALVKAGSPTWMCPHVRHFPPANQLLEMYRQISAQASRLIVIMTGDYFLLPHVPPMIIDAINLERSMGRQFLYMLTLDEVIMGDDALTTSRELSRAGIWPFDWVKYVQTNGVLDFRRRRNPRAYELEMQKLISSIERPGTREF